jgi:hypothetical protein
VAAGVLLQRVQWLVQWLLVCCVQWLVQWLLVC